MEKIGVRKEMTDYLISSDKPIKIIYGYDFLDVDNYEKRDYLVGKAKEWNFWMRYGKDR